MQLPKKALILAGGKGTRLRPLTDTIPKALIEIHGRTITEHLFDLLKKYGIKEIYISVGHLKEKIIDYFKDGTNFGVKIQYIKEYEPLGTAGPLKIGREFFKESLIVSNGDELKKIEIDKMYELHKKLKALATIALTKVEDPSQYGVARVEKNKILEFIEKPKKENAPSNLINAGFYIIEPEVIDMIPDGFCMFEKDIFPKLAVQGKLAGFSFSGQWFDTGNAERLERARNNWVDIKFITFLNELFPLIL